jgi:hypothetical protein
MSLCRNESYRLRTHRGGTRRLPILLQDAKFLWCSEPGWNALKTEDWPPLRAQDKTTFVLSKVKTVPVIATHGSKGGARRYAVIFASLPRPLTTSVEKTDACCHSSQTPSGDRDCLAQNATFRRVSHFA